MPDRPIGAPDFPQTATVSERHGGSGSAAKISTAVGAHGMQPKPDVDWRSEFEKLIGWRAPVGQA